MGSCHSIDDEPAAMREKRNTKSTSLNVTNIFRENVPECAIDKSAISASNKTIESTTRDKMKLWKEELEASGNLTKTVVHIEVSICFV